MLCYSSIYCFTLLYVMWLYPIRDIILDTLRSDRYSTVLYSILLYYLILLYRAVLSSILPLYSTRLYSQSLGTRYRTWVQCNEDNRGSRPDRLTAWSCQILKSGNGCVTEPVELFCSCAHTYTHTRNTNTGLRVVALSSHWGWIQQEVSVYLLEQSHGLFQTHAVPSLWLSPLLARRWPVWFQRFAPQDAV